MTGPGATPAIVPGRSCGTCTLCCKVLAVADLGKAPGTWCAHCRRDKGCTIYDTRPGECRTFFCHWMLEKGLGPEWKPDRAKFALATTENGITAFVDPGYPSSWRAPTYYTTFKRWAAEGARRPGGPHIVSVRIGARAIVVLPDRDVDVGIVGPQEALRLEPSPGGGIDIRKVPQPTATAQR